MATLLFNNRDIDSLGSTLAFYAISNIFSRRSHHSPDERNSVARTISDQFQIRNSADRKNSNAAAQVLLPRRPWTSSR